ncbi:MAG: NAD(P)-binding protein [bacterium]
MPDAASDSPAPPAKRRIAILGGGCGGMAAAWGLVNSELADTLDITIHQLGWRLGGKGASGRNAAIANRIEEHGLHIWGGMYENAFAIMRQVYGQLERPAGTPLSVWYDAKQPECSAFLPHSNTTLAEFYGGTWLPWNLNVPSDDDTPGDGRLLPPVRDYLALVLDLIEELLFGDEQPWQKQFAPPSAAGAQTPLERLGDAARDVADDVARRFARVAFKLAAHEHVTRSRRGLAALPADPSLHTAQHHAAIHEPLADLDAMFRKFFANWLDDHPGLRRVYMILNLGSAVVRGVLDDRILERGIDVIDGLEFRAWLAQHGASKITLDGAVVRAWHDFFFAFLNGDGTQPSFSAASGLRTLFRYAFTYRGAFFWKMQAGMGDTIFAPMYEALKQRGVKFEFFHRVERLGLGTASDGSPCVQTIDISRQVDLAPGVTAYDPLVVVEQVNCWPSEPLYDQIAPAQAARLQAEDIDLESWWTPWASTTLPTLERGTDFDDVILAIPPAAAAHLTGEFTDHSEKWRTMLSKLVSNQTFAVQLWLEPPLDDLGWPHGSTVGTLFANPLNTWANMDQLLKRESWNGRPNPPRSVVYFCGTMTDAQAIPPFVDHGFPDAQHARARESAVTWLDTNLGPLYPAACEPGMSQLRWSVLDRGLGEKGEERFDQQYWRLNIDPSERYVLSLPGGVSYRMRAHESGFKYLYLAGDWLRTGINAGCVEAAVMGGLQASQAISGFPKVIVGDDL